MSNANVVEHLKPDEIRYLALEGGGGKGLAYIGAIKALEKLEVMKHIDGVSGTSAGAITALMLSLGLTVAEVEEELDKHDFNTFFDPPCDSDKRGKRRIPKPFKYEDRYDNTYEINVLAGSLDPEKLLSFLNSIDNQPSVLACLLGMDAWMLAFEGKIGEIIRTLLLAGFTGLTDSPLKPLLEVLFRGLPEYLAYFDRDMGLFSGEAACNYFNDLIQRRIKKMSSMSKVTADISLPFILHKKIFKRDLLLCGTNLSTGKSVLFSHIHTPNFPVADAVRISMGIPIAFKPYIIEEQVPGWPPCGTYVDGGLWNNLPFRELSRLKPDEPPAAKCSSAAARPPNVIPAPTSLAATIGERNTLGLRLKIDPPEKVLTGGDLIAKVLGTVVTAGESQVIKDIEPFTLVLDTEGLELFTFKYDEPTTSRVKSRSLRAMYRYFGETPPPSTPAPHATKKQIHDMVSAEIADDLRGKEIMSKSICK